MSDDVGRHNIKIYEAFNKFSSWMFFFFFFCYFLHLPAPWEIVEKLNSFSGRVN